MLLVELNRIHSHLVWLGTSALELQRLWHHLAQSALVQTMPGEQLKRLFSAMRLHRLEEGSVIAQEGSQEPFLLLIGRGVVEATARIPGGAATLVREFGPGDMIGEAALLERGAWPADYRVSEAATVLQLTRAGLEKCLVGQSDPRGFLEMLRGHVDVHADQPRRARAARRYGAAGVAGADDRLAGAPVS